MANFSKKSAKSAPQSFQPVPTQHSANNPRVFNPNTYVTGVKSSTPVPTDPKSQNFPNVDAKVHRKRWHIVARDIAQSAARSVFSPESGMFGGYVFALGGLGFAVLSYVGLSTVVVDKLGYTGYTSLCVFVIGGVTGLLIQMMELAPKLLVIFPHVADRAAFANGQQQQANPTVTTNSMSMVTSFKQLARHGDSMRARQVANNARLTYILESVGAMTVVGWLLTDRDPIVQIAGLMWGFYVVFGCNFGLLIAEFFAQQVLTADQELAYRVSKKPRT